MDECGVPRYIRLVLVHVIFVIWSVDFAVADNGPSRYRLWPILNYGCFS